MVCRVKQWGNKDNDSVQEEETVKFLELVVQLLETLCIGSCVLFLILLHFVDPKPLYIQDCRCFQVFFERFSLPSNSKRLGRTTKSSRRPESTSPL